MSDTSAGSTQDLKVLFVLAEASPFAKTGGLADVGSALPRALHARGVDVRVFIPRYARISPERYGLTTAIEALDVPLDDRHETVSILKGDLGGGTPIYFVDNDRLFNREGIYGYPDDGERFVLFSRAALEASRAMGWQPDVVHCHDWHTGIIPNWLNTIYRDDPFFAGTASVFTIHNLQYQGVFSGQLLEVAGIDEYGFLVHPRISELSDVVDLMARGIHHADVVSTVSQRYASEILTPEFGEKLDPLLADRRDRLFGIVNGIDVEEQNPATDQHIAARYDATSLDRRAENKAALQREAGLREDPRAPLFGIVSRLADQKGFDILVRVVEPMLRVYGAQLVLLGTGDQHYHNLFGRFANEHPGQAAIFLTFNTALAQRIYAGSDAFLMPSRFEPCGIGQLISLRYGAVPVVRLTGGLADTIHDYDPSTGEGNGFGFVDYDEWALFAAIGRAVEAYRNPTLWRTLQTRGMAEDHSWAAASGRYVSLYRTALEAKREAPP